MDADVFRDVFGKFLKYVLEAIQSAPQEHIPQRVGEKKSDVPLCLRLLYKLWSLGGCSTGARYGMCCRTGRRCSSA